LEGLLPWICDIMMMMMMIGEDLFIHRGREREGDWRDMEGLGGK